MRKGPKRDIYELLLEGLLSLVRGWESFTAEDILSKLRDDITFMENARKERAHMSLHLYKDNINQTISKFQEYLEGNKFVDFINKDEWQRKVYRLSELGKNIKKAEDLRYEERRQDERIVWLTGIIAFGTSIAALYYGVGIIDFYISHQIVSMGIFYFSFGLFIGIVISCIYTNSKRILKGVKRRR